MLCVMYDVYITCWCNNMVVTACYYTLTYYVAIKRANCMGTPRRHYNYLYRSFALFFFIQACTHLQCGKSILFIPMYVQVNFLVKHVTRGSAVLWMTILQTFGDNSWYICSTVTFAKLYQDLPQETVQTHRTWWLICCRWLCGSGYIL